MATVGLHTRHIGTQCLQLGDAAPQQQDRLGPQTVSLSPSSDQQLS